MTFLKYGLFLGIWAVTFFIFPGWRISETRFSRRENGGSQALFLYLCCRPFLFLETTALVKVDLIGLLMSKLIAYLGNRSAAFGL
jgi:hypothetical protein